MYRAPEAALVICKRTLCVDGEIANGGLHAAFASVTVAARI
jgi:hypothetical protein